MALHDGIMTSDAGEAYRYVLCSQYRVRTGPWRLWFRAKSERTSQRIWFRSRRHTIASAPVPGSQLGLPKVLINFGSVFAIQYLGGCLQTAGSDHGRPGLRYYIATRGHTGILLSRLYVGSMHIHAVAVFQPSQMRCSFLFLLSGSRILRAVSWLGEGLCFVAGLVLSRLRY